MKCALLRVYCSLTVNEEIEMNNAGLWMLYFLIIVGIVVVIVVLWRSNRCLNVTVSMFPDVVARWQCACEAGRVMATDHLTGLLNRTVFMHWLDEILRANVAGTVVVIMISVGGLFRVNEALGTKKGDWFLRKIADVLKRNIPQGIIARKGNEFVVAIAIDDCHSIDSFVQTILREITGVELFNYRGVASYVSVGVAFYPDHGDSAYQLMRCAGMAMKKAGRLCRCCVYSDEMATRLDVERALRKCLTGEGDGLELYFQVIVNAQTKEAVSLEVLARFRHNGQLVAPGVFMPVIDRLKFSRQLDEIIFKKVCEQMAGWVSAGFVVPTVCMNVSKFSLERPDFASAVRNVISRHRLSASLFGIEVLESHRIDDTLLSCVVAELSKLHDDGMEIGIDDFGGGNIQFPLLIIADVWKIDRLMTARMDDLQTMEIVKHIIIMAHTIGKKVVAEGVETYEQLEKLRELGCDMVQGFLFSEPVPVDQIVTSWLKQEV